MLDEQNGNEISNTGSEKRHTKTEKEDNDQTKLHSTAKQPPMLKRKFLRCSSLATVTHLKKFIAKKVKRLYSDGIRTQGAWISVLVI